MPINNKLALKRESFTSLLEAKVLVEGYMSRYNQERWHSALDCRIHMAFVAVRDAGCKPRFKKELEAATRSIAVDIGNRLGSILRRLLA
jgi:hypothetical protein